ncbi:hypothetical protein DFJ67_3847 [Asanoa ferruginea]|uniref:Uncharacterized protein n=1 Tax=Asanoa ferruginea TaxID=53367 RepID=A0A3D9ZVZ9_9ACTN|nr:hypothetical protein [Asanoa ferruginea]REF97840.1 hypothetical protein DFJ67_3847 [Asanoa ferruginea]GIF52982.1 hypothetical protein Afe04nite_75210 [Asanoa ferruginea]
MATHISAPTGRKFPPIVITRIIIFPAAEDRPAIRMGYGYGTNGRTGPDGQRRDPFRFGLGEVGTPIGPYLGLHGRSIVKLPDSADDLSILLARHSPTGERLPMGRGNLADLEAPDLIVEPA